MYRSPVNKTEISEEILARLKAGSTRDFMLVYESLQKGLFSFAFQYLKDADLAEDVTQTVFMKLWETRHRINPSLPFKAYLYRITRNEIMDQLSAIAKTEKAKSEMAQALAETWMPSVADTYESSEYASMLEEAIESLPPQRQRVFRLCREDGMTYQEAATQLGISYYTVKEHMTLAVKSIKIHLGRHAAFAVFLFCF